MIVHLMRAARDYVRAKMLADEDLAAIFTELSELDGDATSLPAGKILYEVRATMESTPPPEERHTIEVGVREVKSDMTTLKDWVILCSVGSPVDVAGITLDNHAILETAMVNVWDKSLHEDAEGDLATLVAARLPGWTLGGFHAVGWDEARGDTALLPVYEVKCGVMKS